MASNLCSERPKRQSRSQKEANFSFLQRKLSDNWEWPLSSSALELCAYGLCSSPPPALRGNSCFVCVRLSVLWDSLSLNVYSR